MKWINSKTGAQYCWFVYSLWDLIAYGSSVHVGLQVTPRQVQLRRVWLVFPLK